jgi:pimeloyl-ACP methyl ester carboxylesterase
VSRLTPRPEGYAPGLEVNLRLLSEGGGVRDPADLRGASMELPRERCVLLVHGYNNHDGEAAAAYLGFRERQYGQFPALQPDALEASFGDAYWPGDADWPGPLDYLDFFFYPAAVCVARDEVPQVLAQAIGRIPGLVTLDVVGHSLGCRVALETLRLLHDTARRPALRRLCLMAAAVPCEFLEAGGRFEPLLRALQADGTAIRVLHSTDDLVLGAAFLFGQPLAGSAEASARALGYRGPPPGMPGVGANVSEKRIPNAGHGDYWGHSGTWAAFIASGEAGAFLALDEQPRTVGTRRPVSFARNV